MTPTQIKRKYTRLGKYGNRYSTYLRIDHQEFTIADHTTKRRAEWFREMLVIALHRLLNKS